MHVLNAIRQEEKLIIQVDKQVEYGWRMRSIA